jgi:hypothetical protein
MNCSGDWLTTHRDENPKELYSQKIENRVHTSVIASIQPPSIKPSIPSSPCRKFSRSHANFPNSDMGKRKRNHLTFGLLALEDNKVTTDFGVDLAPGCRSAQQTEKWDLCEAHSVPLGVFSRSGYD